VNTKNVLKQLILLGLSELSLIAIGKLLKILIPYELLFEKWPKLPETVPSSFFV